ncbi:MAG: NAD(P)H-dependent glycerol-3-phosphate dehydrogenase [Candidatus Eiseniibacteriota bacterium]|jgi:glycerol-3-phosphate dehydrogenase (NAD(P)+)
MTRVAVLGAGSWGTTLAILLVARVGHVTLWGRDAGQVERMRAARENRRYLAGVELPVTLEVVSELGTALPGRDVVVFAVPSVALATVARQAAPWISQHAMVVSAVKGLEADGFRRMTQVLEGELASSAAGRVATLSGPSMAREVARGMPTVMVSASTTPGVAREVRDLFERQQLHVEPEDDLVGVEVGVAFKNVVAIAAGISDGLGLGGNARGALLVRGLAEMSRLAASLGGDVETLRGPAGVGDLVTTCTSRLSRNRHVGEELGRGRPLKRILDDMIMVAEGVPTTRAVWQLSGRLGLDMPITEQVHAVLYEDRDPRDIVVELMH